ncbi:hypothetical protein [Fibrella aquatilis]|uniref:Uncharacterized protein n=1 Tax=Fibrella aquatilis TaxID=2817059 RepID=A0A939G9N3_9BACT|nr:hypothetical protein [Fibrella aquatilis]MBO0932616.1 hypothetical protein [Fibrella aquatilis]
MVIFNNYCLRVNARHGPECRWEGGCLVAWLCLLLFFWLSNPSVSQAQLIPKLIPPSCAFTTTQPVAFSAAGGSVGASVTNQYVLTNGQGVILQVANNPNFGPQPAGGYLVYSVIYDNGSPVVGITAGGSVTAIAGTCVRLSAAYPVVVCPESTTCSLFTDQSIVVNLSGGQAANTVATYLLVNENGTIVSTSTSTTLLGPSTVGSYFAYELLTDVGATVSGITVGGSLTAVTVAGGACYSFSAPLPLRICPSIVTCVSVNLKALLEGPYDPTLMNMSTALNENRLLPGQQPSSPFAQPTPAGQPYNTAPWNYSGTEGKSPGFTYDADVVDWVLVSLRTSSQSANAVFRAAALLHNDGRITFVDPCLQVPSGNYFVVVEHRNHLGVMSATAVPVTNDALNFDFSIQQSYVMADPPSFGQTQINGRYLLYAADGKKDTYRENFDINTADSQLWKMQSGIFLHYLPGDFNLDADVNADDNVLWKRNNGRYSAVPH